MAATNKVSDTQRIRDFANDLEKEVNEWCEGLEKEAREVRGRTIATKYLTWISDLMKERHIKPKKEL
jgi:hypothetical protein